MACPSRRALPARLRRRRRWRAVRRGRRRAAGSPRARRGASRRRGPSRTRTCRAAGVASTASSVSARAARASAAAWRGVHGGHSRVLLCPARGALARTMSAVMSSTRAMSPIARAVPRTVPVTFERPMRGRYATATSWILHPATAARSTISRGQPKRRSAIPSSSSALLLAARIGPRSVSGAPLRRRSSRASTRLATRACAGHAPRWAMRAPRTRSAAPSRTGAQTRGRSRGCSDASPSMKHTTSVRAARRPAQHAAPKPRAGSLTTWAPSARAMAADPSPEPLSTTIAR